MKGLLPGSGPYNERLSLYVVILRSGPYNERLSLYVVILWSGPYNFISFLRQAMFAMFATFVRLERLARDKHTSLLLARTNALSY